MHTIHKLSHSHRRRVIAQAAPTWYDNNGLISGCWAAYQPKGAASLAASYTDLTGQGRDVTVGGAITWDAVNGWIFDGSTSYLITTFIPPQDADLAVIIQYSAPSAENDARMIGTEDVNQRLYILPNHNNVQVTYRNGTNAIPVAPPLLAGNLAISGSQAYRNGTPEGSSIAGYSVQSAEPLFIGCNNDNGSPRNRLTGTIQAFAIYDPALSDADVATIAAAMAAL